MRSLHALSLILVGGLLFMVGCDMATIDPQAEALVPSHTSKLRHWDLLDRTDQEGTSPVLRAFSGAGEDSVGVVLTFDEDTDMDEAERELDIVFGTLAVRGRKYYRQDMKGAALVVASTQVDALIRKLQNTPFIEYIEPDVPLVFDFEQALVDLSDAGGQVTPWQVYTANAHEGPAKAGDGRGSVDVDLFIIDTAIEDNPDLNIVEAVRFHEGDTSYDSTHGTHIAGIAAAKDNDAGIVGVAPGARIHSLDVIGPDGFALMSDLVAAVEHVHAFKQANPSAPVVLNMSVGADVGTEEYNALDEAVQRAIDAGVTVVVAAGNDDEDARFNSPAHVEDAITVGAAMGFGMYAPFSNHGERIDIVAVGVDVLSSIASGQFAEIDGTSQATPSVAGAALTYLWLNPAASPAEVRDRLVRDAQNSVWRWGLPSKTTRKGVHIPKMDRVD
ncbi:MAG: S8 family serine peptidase [Bacteroidota bacterium]